MKTYYIWRVDPTNCEFGTISDRMNKLNKAASEGWRIHTVILISSCCLEYLLEKDC